MPSHYIGGGGRGSRKVFEGVFELVFTNRETKKQIRMLVPNTGIFHDPKRDTTQGDLRALSDAITEVLKRQLDTPEGEEAYPGTRTKSRDKLKSKGKPRPKEKPKGKG